jgi:hypothetical protein
VAASTEAEASVAVVAVSVEEAALPVVEVQAEDFKL